MVNSPLTTSGLCFVLSNAADFKDIKPWTKWPGVVSSSTEHLKKVPSVIAYASENPDLDHDVFGYEVESWMKSCSWSKLLLDQKALATEYDDPNLMKAASNGLMHIPQGKTAKMVVTDYLKHIHRMFTEAINQLGLEANELTRSLPMDIWLTVPASWSDEAKWATREAALAAGFASRQFDQVYLISEPEAAAHLALKDSLYHVNELVKVSVACPEAHRILTQWLGRYRYPCV